MLPLDAGGVVVIGEVLVDEEGRHCQVIKDDDEMDQDGEGTLRVGGKGFTVRVAKKEDEGQRGAEEVL